MLKDLIVPKKKQRTRTEYLAYYSTSDKAKKARERYECSKKGKLNKAKQHEKWRDRNRKRLLFSKNGTIHRNLNKRDWTGYCEICKVKKDKWLDYHHWDDNNLNKGIWLCQSCHKFVEKIDKGYLSRYMRLRKVVNENLRRIDQTM